MKKAMYYERCEDKVVQCELCPHRCRIRESAYGICGVRRNLDGDLIAESYGKITGIAMDPVEKKPLYHFYPGKYILSIGSFGCNLKCSFCQNWHISQKRADFRLISPEELVSIAEMQEGNVGIAYTYNEPSVGYEYVYECAQLAKQRGLKNVMVTNGYISIQPLNDILQYVDAMNIDVKSFSDEYYKKLCGGKLNDVIKSVETAYARCHVELTTLIVTGENDDLKEIKELAKWVASIDRDIPLHFTRYYPAYKMKNPATPVETLLKAYQIGKEYLNYVYIGNVVGIDRNTYCPECGNLLIKRMDWVEVEGITDEKKCSRCGKNIKIQI
ncbi:AmmeMemoRadiSam system radical SAM enzyme [Caldanaerobius polysaccharolyticus]|uniref:AmmeMemoRadiSam system radical SAM enzyme n=1 Tax=Caldanaerobius polysaccharolyticus TaxID=44256 RepID=UPI00047AA337|nr:AmmeMemoRadiSam system radical SAM enzyme [Caldanaerobius polysaccharolyticus]